MNLEDLGYNEFFDTQRNQLKLEAFSVARVISEAKGAYGVKNQNGEFLARITGKQMYNAKSREDYPAVGDWVAIEELNGGQAVIRRVLPRRTIIKRKSGDRNRAGEKNGIQVIAANIDEVFVVESVDRDYNLNRLERYCAIAENGGAKAVIILNKIDLLPEGELEEKLAEVRNRFPGTDVVATSASGSEGLDELKRHIARGKTYCFLGSSGVGKSSLINSLIGESVIKTGDIGSGSGRGKHTTTGRQMYFLQNGGIVIDNPGIREVGILDVGRPAGGSSFDEINVLAQHCRFSDCTHTQEPGCEVLRALNASELDEEKYRNFLAVKKETEYNQMNDFEKRNKDRQFGKFLKNAKKDFRNFKHKDY